MSPHRSALYVGRVRHRRHAPTEHAFGYGVYQAAIDLDELPVLDRRLRLFGWNRRAVTTFHDTDHLGPLDAPVKVKLAAWLRTRGHQLRPDDRVILLTNLRVFGYVFNPVSWYFVRDHGGDLRFVVVEVHNTFGETYCYLLDDLVRGAGGAVRSRRAKRFHVSPFQRVEGAYDFTLHPPAERVVTHIDVSRDGEQRRFFDATFAGERRALTDGQLGRALLRYPLVTLHTIAAIHWQALKLWLKRVPWLPKPDAPANDLPEHLSDLPTDLTSLEDRRDERIHATAS